MRRSAPADVSPESPALIAVIGTPSAAALAATITGNACDGSSPYPAVRLVPKNSTLTFPESFAVLSPFDALGESAAGTASAGTRLAAVAPSIFRSGWHAARAPRNTIQEIFMLIAKEVTREYRSGDHNLAVLKDVSFSIPQGDFVAIVGPSGSGKTTLLGLLAGLDTPTRGRVILDGHDLTTMSENERAKLRGEKVGFVFQSFQLIPTLTDRKSTRLNSSH